MLRWFLLAVQQLDRLRLAWLHWRHPGLHIDPRASTNLACARYELGPGATLTIRRAQSLGPVAAE